MTATSPPQVSFSSGEISPLLWRRTNYERFQTGLRTCRGFLPMREGGFTRAPGTWYRGTTRNNAPCRRIPFQFAKNDALELEFTDGIMRVWRYGALVMAGASPYELVIPYAAADLENLDWVQSADVIYIADGAHPVQKLSRFALDNWTIEDAALNTGPFRAQNLDHDQRIQCSEAYSTMKLWEAGETGLTDQQTLRRWGENVYLFVSGDNAGDTPPTHTSGIVRTDAVANSYWGFAYTIATEGNITVLSAGFDLTQEMEGSVFMVQVEDYSNIALWTGNTDISVGTYMRYDGNIYQLEEGEKTGVNPPIHTEGTHLVQKSPNVKWKFISDDTGIFRITNVLNTNAALAEVIKTIPIPCVDSPSYRWSQGAWSEVFGYPRSLRISGQRLFAARTPSEPRGLWHSVVGDYLDFEPSTDADGSGAYVLDGSDTQNEINWLAVGRKGLYIGALGEIYRAFSNVAGQVIGPTTFDTSLEATDGTIKTRPIAPYGFPVYITKDGRRLQELRYSFAEDGSKPLEISAPSAHLGNGGFAELAWQSAPLRHIWVRRDIGDLALCLYDPDEKVLGWAVVPLAGGVVESITVSPAADGARDVLTIVVRRTIDGQTVRCVEEQAMTFGALTNSDPISTANHLFCASEFAPDPATDVFAVPHLVGQQVYAWTDRGNMGPFTVPVGGEITLPIAVSHAIIGLFDDTHEAETLDISAATQNGDSRGRIKRALPMAGVMLHNSAAGRVQAIERELGIADRARPLVDLVRGPVAAPLINGYSGVSAAAAVSGGAREITHRFKPVGGAPLTVLGYVPAIDEAGL